MNEWVVRALLLMLLFRILNNKERKKGKQQLTVVYRTTQDGNKQNKRNENPFASAIAAYMSHYTKRNETHRELHYEEGGQGGGG